MVPFAGVVRRGIDATQPRRQRPIVMNRPSDELINETDLAILEVGRTLPNLEEAPLPAAVYHYTDAAGLQGILDSGVLWATDYRYLNDSSELRYIFDLAVQSAENSLRSGDHGPLAQAFLEYVSTSSPYGDQVYYLCCFSEADNSLSQWRAYGGRQGFSFAFPGDITFKPDLIDIPARQGQSAGMTLLKVDYQIEHHTEYVIRLIQAFTGLCEGTVMQSYGDPDLAISWIAPAYFGTLERASYRFKHPDFSDEREWRLVSWGKHDEHFRVGATLTPYAKFQLFSASHSNPETATALRYPQRLPLIAVRHGPTALPDETRLAMDRLLRSRGYPADYCERRGSNTPVRL